MNFSHQKTQLLLNKDILLYIKLSLYSRKMMSLLLIIVCQFIYTQNIDPQTLNYLTKELEELSSKQAADLVYLQTSKGIYETQEDVWFKGYVLDAQYFTPSAKSNILFVQLINNVSNKPVWEEKYEIENGFVDGQLFLSDTLSAGKYTLSAYSSHSYFKEQKEFYAFKKIEVVKNIQSPPPSKPVLQDSIVHFTLFPEGGHWVSGIESRMAFKAINTQGYPIAISGILYENNKPVLNFKSTHAGMGSFLYTPDVTKNYHIALETPNQEKKHPLPKIEAKGKTLQLLGINPKTAVFKISQSEGFPTEKIYLRIQVRGVLYGLAMATLNKELQIRIPLKDLPQGIAEITLFDAALMPVAERLVYVNPDEKLYIKSSLNKIKYETREKGHLKIQVTDKNGAPVIAHLGMSIYDHLYKSKTTSTTIESHYQLNSQLKGKIYNPSYYFNLENKNRKEALNLLLLTQGWRSYHWSASTIKEQLNFKSVVSDSYQGTIKFKYNQKKIPDTAYKMAKVFTADSLKGSDLIMTDSLGRFSISSQHLKMGERAYVYVQALTPEKPKHVIRLPDHSFKNINEARAQKTRPDLPLQIEEKEYTESIPFVEPSTTTKLDEVIITKKKKHVFRDKYLGKLDSLAKLELITDYVGPCGTLNCPMHKTERTLPVEGLTYSEMIGWRWVDESRRAYAVDGYKVGEYHYPELTEAYLLKKYNLIMLKGYYGKKEFYQPVYDKESINDSFPDTRNTLFWKSDIITNKKGEANIEFVCSDVNTAFFGHIEGVSGDGLLGTANFEFVVRKN